MKAQKHCKQEFIDFKPWMQARHSLLCHYWNISGLTTYQPIAPIKKRLETFCQLLIDYGSMGHFSMYEKLFAAITHSHPKGKRIIARIYPRILKTTDDFVDFNDYYDRYAKNITQPKLSHQLSLVGESLATRMNLEDELIAASQNARSSPNYFF